MRTFDNYGNNRRIRQRRGVTDFVRLLFYYFPENLAHDLTRSRFWQPWRELDMIRRCDGANLSTNELNELLAKLICPRHPFVKDHERIDALSLDLMWKSDDGRFSNVPVQNKSARPSTIYYTYTLLHSYLGDFNASAIYTITTCCAARARIDVVL